jgi:1A family penicillin-binding protein
MDILLMDWGRSRRRSRLRRKRSLASFGSAGKLLAYNKLLRIALYSLIAGLILLPLLFLWYARDLPTPGKLITSQVKDATRIYDRDGELLYSVFQDENRTYVNISEIPKVLQEATISIEDKDFYKNKGFSPAAYLRVARDAVLGRGLTGGSTISQQLVKNVLLTNERSLPRKIKELILAIQVNQRYEKDEILEMYLNNIPYGGTAIGVEAASQQYFGKKVAELGLFESAFLAGLPQSPSRYAPFTGGTAYVGRTEAVLKQMVENDYITEDEADEALQKLKKYNFSDRDEAIKAPHFVIYVRKLLAEQFGENAVTAGGLQVTTSLDYEIQEKAEEIVKKEVEDLKEYQVGNGAAVVSDPRSGEILSMVGSKDYFDESEPDGCSPGVDCVFDPDPNVATSNTRQPGSSMKPVMYATAFERGYTPATLIMDTKTDFPTNSDPPMYSPVNYDGKFRGPVQARYALANSLNIPAVKLLAQVGIEPVMRKAYEMGIKNWEPTRENISGVGLALVLGGRETSLLDEVTAYSVFANKGIRQDPVAILKVTDPDGKVLYEKKKTDGKKVLSEEVAFLISHILLDDSARSEAFGRGSLLNIPGKSVAVKTGTTDNKRDNWAIGYTPSYVVGVWVGNNNNSPMNQAIASGVTGASPIWNKIMAEVLKNKPNEDFEKPENVIALIVDSFVGGLPHGAQPTRSEYFVKGTEPVSESPVYKSKDGQEFFVFKEEDPVSTDGKNRWQEGINFWIEQNKKDDKMWNPPDELKNQNQNPASPTPTPSPTP